MTIETEMTCNCGLPMSRNPHPSAGDPTYEGVEVGYQYECIPCLVKTRNRVGREMREAQAENERLRKVLERILDDPGGAWAYAHDALYVDGGEADG